MTDQARLPVEFDAAVRSVPELLAAARAEPHWSMVERSLHGLVAADVPTLISRIETVTNPLVLWTAHWELDRRDVPPCLRARRNDSMQDVFLTWAADALWLSKRATSRKPLFTRWNGLFTQPANGKQWHRVARWVYAGARGRHGHYFARGLGLTDAERQPLLTMPTGSMQADRRLLSRLGEMHGRLLAHALQNRDLAGDHPPAAVASRRAELLRLYLLAGRQQTLAARYYTLLTGERLSRQALGRQLDTIELATGLRKLKC